MILTFLFKSAPATIRTSVQDSSVTQVHLGGRIRSPGKADQDQSGSFFVTTRSPADAAAIIAHYRAYCSVEDVKVYMARYIPDYSIPRPSVATRTAKAREEISALSFDDDEEVDLTSDSDDSDAAAPAPTSAPTTTLPPAPIPPPPTPSPPQLPPTASSAHKRQLSSVSSTSTSSTSSSAAQQTKSARTSTDNVDIPGGGKAAPPPMDTEA